MAIHRMIRLSPIYLKRMGLAAIAAVWWLLLCLPAQAVDLTLAWDPNTEPDLAGYAAFIRKNAPPADKHLDGHVALADLDDPNNPSYTFTGLEKNNQYYIALKAYNQEGKYSAFSSPLCIEVGESIQACTQASGDGSGGGSQNDGGSGGCFISSAGEGLPGGLNGLILVSTAACALFLARRRLRTSCRMPLKD
jgi:hypothetical protein